MSQYEADPRAEELQLLRQLRRAQPTLATTQSATITVLDRLVMKGEAMSWPWPGGPGYVFEITATGYRTALQEELTSLLKAKLLGVEITREALEEAVDIMERWLADLQAHGELAFLDRMRAM